MFTIATILAILVAIAPAEVEAKSIRCPSVVTYDIKNRKQAIKSCDTMFIDKKGNIKKVPKRITRQYKYKKNKDNRIRRVMP